MVDNANAVNANNSFYQSASAKPPTEMSFEGNLASNWQFFKQKFEIYLKAAKLENEDDSYKAALLLNMVGDRVIQIYNNLVFEEPEDKSSYTKIFDKLNEYFIPTKNVTYERNVFFTRDMKIEETVDEYVNALRHLSTTCEFKDLTDSLIKDRLVLGIQDRSVKDRLFREPKLDLKKAIEICKASELAQKQLQQISSAKVDIVKQQKKHGSRTAGHKQPYRENTQPKPQPREVPKNNGCYCCGGDHPRGKHRCPAKTAVCNKCKKVGHYAKVCKSVNTIACNSDDTESDKQELFIGNICNSIDNSWVQKCKLNDSHDVVFKLDTGAAANILPLHIFKKLNVHDLKPSRARLTGYNNDEIEAEGMCKIKTVVNNIERFIDYQVVNTKNCPILGLDACCAFQLILRPTINSIVANPKLPNLEQIVNNYKNCFKGLGCLKNYTHHITVDSGVQPVVHAARKVPFAIQGDLKRKLNQLETDGVVSKVTQPTNWVNSLVIVHKKDKSLRLCLDPTNLNRAIKREHFKIPTIDEILSKVSGAKYFSTIDCSNGFWQIKLDNESSLLCTFNTPFGRYKFNRLPYGICSAPEVFTKVLRQMFDSVEGVDVYVDDIIIWGKNAEEHNKRLETVLKIAAENDLKFNMDKCKFGLTEITYMGYRVSSKGILPDLNKCEAIRNIQVPNDKKGIERLLGMIQYLAKHIPSCSIVTAPLRELLKKDVEFQWNPEQQNALDKIKKALVNPPMLYHFDIEKPLTISCDASQNGCAAVLLQESKPVAYMSRAFTPTQIGYAQIEKEMLAILLACEKFHQYIYGRTDVTIETDHSPLITIYKKPLTLAPARLQRMLIKLQQYSFNLKYKKGTELYIADTLSRSFSNNEVQDEPENEYDAQLCFIVDNLPITERKLNDFKTKTMEDSVLVDLIEIIQKGFPENKTELPEHLHKFWAFREDLTTSDNLLFKGNKLFVPDSLRAEMLNRIHYAHLGKEKCKNLARDVLFWPGMSRDIDNLIEYCDTCTSLLKNNTKETLRPHDVPDNVWSKIGVDIFTLYDINYLLVVDYFSKFVELRKLNSLTTDSVIVILKEIFSRQGIPNIVFSDNGPQFSSEQFAKFSETYDFAHHTSSPRYPQSNGMAERTIQTVKLILKKCVLDKKDPYLAMLEYRNTPISNGLPSPSQILNSRRLRGIIPVTDKVLKKQVVSNKSIKRIFEKQKEKEKDRYDRNARDLQELKINDVVRVKVDLENKDWRKGIIVNKASRPRCYIVKLDSGRILERNRKFLIKIRNNENDCNDVYHDSHVSETEPVTLEHNNLPSLEVPAQSSTSQVTSRSGRVIRPPKRYCE